jgi:hypothetical protein
MSFIDDGLGVTVIGRRASGWTTQFRAEAGADELLLVQPWREEDAYRINGRDGYWLPGFVTHCPPAPKGGASCVLRVLASQASKVEGRTIFPELGTFVWQGSLPALARAMHKAGWGGWGVAHDPRFTWWMD